MSETTTDPADQEHIQNLGSDDNGEASDSGSTFTDCDGGCRKGRHRRRDEVGRKWVEQEGSWRK
jgi:hypothetical protein